MRYVLIFLALLGFSCETQEYEQAQRFATMKFDNQSGVETLQLAYNNDVFEGQLFNIKVPAGTGVFSFVDSHTGQSLLDTVMTIEANSTQSLILFKPGSTVPLNIIENMPQTEPKPEAGFIKLKVADFSALFTDPIDIIVCGFNDDLWDFVPMDTVRNIPSQFEDEYIIVKAPNNFNDPSLIIKIMDSNTQEVLTTSFPLLIVDPYNWQTSEFYSVFTIFFLEDEFGTPVSGTSSKIQVRTLFRD